MAHKQRISIKSVLTAAGALVEIVLGALKNRMIREAYFRSFQEKKDLESKGLTSDAFELLLPLVDLFDFARVGDCRAGINKLLERV